MKLFYITKIKVIICSLFLCFAFIPLSAVDIAADYGADISSTYSFGEWLAFDQKISPWVDLRFCDGWRFTAQGSAYLRLNPKRLFYRPFFDVDLFRIQTKKIPFCHGFVTFELGRIKIKDAHEMIVSDTADGAAIHVAIPGIIMDLTESNTGFMSYYTSKALLSYDDFVDASVLPEAYYGLGSRRAIFQWSTLFPEFIGRADVFGDMIAQVDLRRVVNDSKYTKQKKEIKELINSMYLATGINGPFPKSTKLYYDFGVVGEVISRQTLQKNETFMAGYLNAGMSWFLMGNMQLATRFQYGTPNTDDGSSEYRPITYKNAGIFYEGGFADLFKPELSLKWKPTPQVAFVTSLSGFIRPIKKGTIKKADRENFEKVYKYTEFALGGTFVISRDVRIGADIMYGVNSAKKKRMFDYSVQFKINVGL